MGVLVWTRGRDEQYAGLTPGLTPGHGQAGQVVRGSAPTVAVQFTPPAGVQPGMLGTIVDESANTVDVAATVIDLAVRGHLTLEETQSGLFGRTDWRLTRPGGVVSDPTPLHPYEQRLLTGLFATGDSVLLSELKNHFASTLKSVQEAMYTDVVDRGWFRRSPEPSAGSGPAGASSWCSAASPGPSGSAVASRRCPATGCRSAPLGARRRRHRRRGDHLAARPQDGGPHR